MATIAEVAQQLHAKRTGKGRFLAKCPSHQDRKPSLAISLGKDGRILLKCWAGCETEAVLKAAGLRWADLFPESGKMSAEELLWARLERQFAEQRRREERRLQRIAEDRERLANACYIGEPYYSPFQC